MLRSAYRCCEHRPWPQRIAVLVGLFLFIPACHHDMPIVEELALGVGYALADDFTAKRNNRPCPKALTRTLREHGRRVNHGFNYSRPMDTMQGRKESAPAPCMDFSPALHRYPTPPSSQQREQIARDIEHAPRPQRPEKPPNTPAVRHDR